MTASTSATTSRPNIVAEIVRELNMEIGFCPILRNLKREKDCGVIDDRAFHSVNRIIKIGMKCSVYLGRILESVLTCQLQSVTPDDVKKDRSSSGRCYHQRTYLRRSKVHLVRILGLVLLMPPRKKMTRWTSSASNTV